MNFLYSFLHSLPRSQLVHLVQTAIITFLVGFVSLGAFMLYMKWEDRKEAAEEKMEQTIIYGIKETAVTIQHQHLDKDDEAFLRHVRALSRQNLEFHEIMETLENFTEFLHAHSHPNYEDMAIVRRILRRRDLASAWSWLIVAQAFWILHPWDEMLPYIDYDSMPATSNATPQPTPQPTPQTSPYLRPMLETQEVAEAPVEASAEVETHTTSIEA